MTDQPPASLEHHSDQWRARCERCGGHSKGYLRISHTLAAQERHGRVHVARDTAAGPGRRATEKTSPVLCHVAHNDDMEETG